MPKALKTPYFDHVACVDYESYYETKRKDAYSLRSASLTMTDYIRDSRFEAQTVAVQLDTWSKPKVAYGIEEANGLMAQIDWANTAFLAHHTQFDGLIATHHQGIFPAFWLDTMSMARLMFGVDVSVSLDALAKRFGLAGKVHAASLADIANTRLADMTEEQVIKLGIYNCDDVADTLEIYRKMTATGAIPLDELRAIDFTMRMYCEPTLELDNKVLTELHGREVERRTQAIATAQTDKRTLGSSQRFADLLRSLGVVPPQKHNSKGEIKYAFARTDLAFKDLLTHPDVRVVAAVEARLRTKSALVENRSKRLMARAGLPTPVYLGYAAARTLRWGGGDKVNLQNLPSRGDGANLRRAIMAPPGWTMVVGDARQIEARMNAWIAQYRFKLEAFIAFDEGRGPDIYAVAAGGIFGFEVDPKLHPNERFIGKVYELAGGYGAGAIRMRNTLRLGIYGDPVEAELHEVKANLARWRVTNQGIIDNWKIQEAHVVQSFIHGQEIVADPFVFESYKGDGYMHLPNGTYMKYPDVHWNEKDRAINYITRKGPAKLWGGTIVENECQALSCALLKWQALNILDRLEHARLAHTVHDELIFICPDKYVEEYAAVVTQEMARGPDWIRSLPLALPLNSEVKIGKVYPK